MSSATARRCVNRYSGLVRRTGMKSTSRTSGALLVAALSVFALSGCFPGDPIVGPAPTLIRPTPSSTSTPEPEPSVAEPIPTSVVISASSIAVLDETSTVIVDIPFTTNGTTAGNQLAEALGVAPEVVSFPVADCYPAGSAFKWDGLALFTAGSAEMATGQVFEVTASSAVTSAGIAVYGPQSLQVGASLDEVNAALPGAFSEFIEGGDGVVGLETYIDPRWSDLVGVRGTISAGALFAITSPIGIVPRC